MKLNFTLIEKARKNLFYIEVMYEGGDADTEHIELYYVKDSKGNNINSLNYSTPENLKLIKEEISLLKKLKSILEINSPDYLTDFNKVEKLHGKEMSQLFDSVPNDPQNDYQDKCYLGSIHLIIYDNTGDKYTSYVNLNLV